MTCPICGAEFERRQHNQKYCSRKCMRVAWKRRGRSNHGCRDLAAEAHACSHLASNETIMRSPRKPKGVSAVRWRIELRRRANPEKYAYADV